MSTKSARYGLLAEFDSAEALLKATRRAYEAGYRKMDAFTPFPVEGLDAALGFHRTGLPWIALIAGVIGAVGGFALQYWTSVIDYPINVGGRPLNSWPSFIVVSFELTILLAAGGTVLGMLALNGLPMPYHPVFNVSEFKLASNDRFFLCIEAADPQFDPEQTRRFMEGLDAREVYDVEP